MNELFIKLNTLIQKYENFIIMGHKHPDLDVLGSALGLYSILKAYKKNAYIFLNKDNLEQYNSSIVRAVNMASAEYTYIDDYINKLENCLLCIVDVHQQRRLEFPNIIDDNIDTIILDHHILSESYIKNNILLYADSTLSSVVELMTLCAKYNNINIEPTIASIMLAGMYVDTNNFSSRTTAQTFMASAELMKMGASLSMQQELCKQTKEEYLKISKIIAKSQQFNGNKELCVLNDTCKPEELAKVADQLIEFSDTEASFAIGKLSNDNIRISARSKGNYDVEQIMKEFNGGGKLDSAAAEVSGRSINEVKQILKGQVKKKVRKVV